MLKYTSFTGADQMIFRFVALHTPEFAPLLSSGVFKAKMSAMRATRALIHTENLRHNLQAVRKIIAPDTKICLAVKADGYGHGAVGIAESATAFGADYLAVAAVSEAEDLRQNGITAPIMVLSPVLPEEMETLVELRLEAVISTDSELRLIREAGNGSSVGIHLKVDTGMGRIGCPEDEAVRLAGLINSAEMVTLKGICTHFPVSDSSDPSDVEYTKNQIAAFRNVIDAVKKSGINPGIIHAANSGGILNYPEAHFDMVRPGILAYGYLPGGEEALLNRLDKSLYPKPVMSFESRLMHIKKVPAGTDISYGRKYTTEKETWIGTIPAGYADGYTRKLSNRARILINGRLYPVAGTICMDLVMVDLGPELRVSLYDKAILFGSEEGAMDAADLTAITETIPYELLCGISKRVPRIFD